MTGNLSPVNKLSTEPDYDKVDESTSRSPIAPRRNLATTARRIYTYL